MVLNEQWTWVKLLDLLVAVTTLDRLLLQHISCPISNSSNTGCAYYVDVLLVEIGSAQGGGQHLIWAVLCTCHRITHEWIFSSLFSVPGGSGMSEGHKQCIQHGLAQDILQLCILYFLCLAFSAEQLPLFKFIGLIVCSLMDAKAKIDCNTLAVNGAS